MKINNAWHVCLLMLLCATASVIPMEYEAWGETNNQDQLKYEMATLSDSAKELPFSICQEDHVCLKALIKTRLQFQILSTNNELVSKNSPLGYINKGRVVITGAICLISNFIDSTNALKKNSRNFKKQKEEQEEKACKAELKLSQLQNQHSKLLSEKKFYIRMFALSAFSTLGLLVYVLCDKLL